MTSPCLIAALSSTTGPPPSPALALFTYTFTKAPLAIWVMVTLWSPHWTGATCGAGSAEQGRTTVPPGVLGGLPGHICCTTDNVSPLLRGVDKPARCAYPQVRQTPMDAPFSDNSNRAPFTRFVIRTCWAPSYAGSIAGGGSGLGGGTVLYATEGGL